MNLTEKYKTVLLKSPLFAGMTDSGIDGALELLNGKVRVYEKGDLIHKPWTMLTEFGLVLSGVVQACSDDIDGNRMIMTEVQPGTTFGESLCYLKTKDSPVYIHASEDASVLWLSLDILCSDTTDKQVHEMQKRFMRLLASRTLAMNNRIQILSRLTIRDKLIVYFSELSAAAGKNTFNVPLNREDMATYIGADRAALSRELSKMRKEGIIDFYKNSFTIKKRFEK